MKNITILRLTGARTIVNSMPILLLDVKKSKPAADGEVRPS